MGSPLTDLATPAELADRQQAIETKENILGFARLAQILGAELSGVREQHPVAQWQHFPVAIKLRFAWADSRRERVSLVGELKATVGAICQRCLEPFELELEAELDVLLLPPGVASDAKPGRETWELDDEWLCPADIVEESLIMAMPLAARHEDNKRCGAISPDKPTERGGTVRPFAGLRSRLQK